MKNRGVLEEAPWERHVRRWHDIVVTVATTAVWASSHKAYGNIIVFTESYRERISFDRDSVGLFIRARHATKCHTRRVLRGQADQARPPGQSNSYTLLIRDVQ